MIKIKCSIDQTENKYILKPLNSLSDLNLVNNSKHYSENFDTNYIFDLRKHILNNKYNSNLHFYVALFDENNNIINFDESDKIYSTLYTFNRVKEKKKKKVYLNYYPIIRKFKYNLCNNIFYFGFSDLITSKSVAFENSGCLYNYYSENGGGFYGFYFTTAKNIKVKYADLIIKKMNYQKINFISYTNNVIDNECIIEPSAPDFINDNEIEPSAPDFDNFYENDLNEKFKINK
tara:strand:- start:1076 stop:1774 length:699 start_codon:yes stop_codon:yes gene_type:complete